MRLRGRLMGSFLSARIAPDLCHTIYGYPLLLARRRKVAIVLPGEDAVLFEVIEATADEWQALTDAR